MDGPIHDPLEMDSNWPKIESYVQNNEQYQALFKRAGNLPISIDNIKASIVEFVKGLETQARRLMPTYWVTRMF